MSGEVWRGSVRTWECDEMGHQNARFYFAQAFEGLAEVAAWLGVPNAFAADATIRITITDQHVRFLKEAHDGKPLYMRAWIVARGQCDAEIGQILYHVAGDERAATFLTRICCTDAAGAPIPWPNPVAPEESDATAFTRGLVSGGSRLDTMSESQRAGVLESARGLVMSDECDASGRMRTDAIVGRIAEGMRLIVRLFEGHAGSAALECRLAYHCFPRNGTRFQVRCGILAVEEKTRRMMSWLIDPASDELLATLESIEIAFDLETRKAISWPSGVRTATERILIGGAPL